jgi:hypothetical protein
MVYLAIHKSMEGESSLVKRIIYAARGGVNNKLNYGNARDSYPGQLPAVRSLTAFYDMLYWGI